MTTVAASIPVLRWAAQRLRLHNTHATIMACLGCQKVRIAHTLASNKTRQGYARERTLKPAGYFVMPQQGAVA